MIHIDWNEKPTNIEEYNIAKILIKNVYFWMFLTGFFSFPNVVFRFKINI